jgi:hypothetical protein
MDARGLPSTQSLKKTGGEKTSPPVLVLPVLAALKAAKTAGRA